MSGNSRAYFRRTNFEYEIKVWLSTTLKFKYYETPLNVNKNQVYWLKFGFYIVIIQLDPITDTLRETQLSQFYGYETDITTFSVIQKLRYVGEI
jgi:hypothetical protein